MFTSPWTLDSSWDISVKEWLDREISARESLEEEAWDGLTDDVPTSQTPRPESPEERGTRTPRPDDRPPALHIEKIPAVKFIHGLATPTTPSFDESDSDAQAAQRFRPKPKELTRIRGQLPITPPFHSVHTTFFPPEGDTPPKKLPLDILSSPKSPGLPTPPRTPVSDYESLPTRKGPFAPISRPTLLQQRKVVGYGMSTISEGPEASFPPQESSKSKPNLSRKRMFDEKDINLAHSEAPSSRPNFNMISESKTMINVDKQLPIIQSNENTPTPSPFSSFSQFSLSVPEHVVSVGTQAKESRRSSLPSPSLTRRSSLRPSPLRQSLQLPPRRDSEMTLAVNAKHPSAVGRSYTHPALPSRLRTMSRPEDVTTVPLVEESETEPSPMYITPRTR